MKKVFLMLFIGAVLTGACFAADFTHGPDSVQPKDLLISGGFDIGRASVIFFSNAMFGFTFAVDYALPKFGLTIGGETGYSGSSVGGASIGVVPIMPRLGYHPDFGVKNLDIYALIKMGMALGFALDEGRPGFGFGFDLGARYFFTQHIGAFGELGYDGYFFNVEGVSLNGAKFLTIGITYKL
jgi:hypothetical protein